MAQQVFPPLPIEEPGESPPGGSVDAELVARSLRGDSDAFAALFDRHSPRVYALAYQLVGDHGEAEDITQDAFLQALGALPTLRRSEVFGAWVARIATNAALSTLRQRGRLPRAELTEAVVETHPDTTRWGSPEAMNIASEEQRSVYVTLNRLAPSHRAALAMREIGGLSYVEIARALGTSTGGVETLLFRARARFRDEYRKVNLGAAPVRATTCQQARRSLAALADDELPAPRRAEVVSHVRGCDACAATLQAQREARRLLAALPLVAPPTVKLATLSKVGPLLSHYAASAAAGGAAAGGGVAATGAVAGSGAAGSVAAGSMGAAGGATAATSTVVAGGTAATSTVVAGGTAATSTAVVSSAATGAVVTGGTAAAGATVASSAATTVVAGGAAAASATVATGAAAGASAVLPGAVGAIAATSVVAKAAAAVVVAGAVAVSLAAGSPSQHAASYGAHATSTPTQSSVIASHRINARHESPRVSPAPTGPATSGQPFPMVVGAPRSRVATLSAPMATPTRKTSKVIGPVWAGGSNFQMYPVLYSVATPTPTATSTVAVPGSSVPVGPSHPVRPRGRGEAPGARVAALALSATATVAAPTSAPIPATATDAPPTATAIPPTSAPVPPTATANPPTATRVPPTSTPTTVSASTATTAPTTGGSSPMATTAATTSPANLDIAISGFAQPTNTAMPTAVVVGATSTAVVIGAAPPTSTSGALTPGTPQPTPTPGALAPPTPGGTSATTPIPFATLARAVAPVVTSLSTPAVVAMPPSPTGTVAPPPSETAAPSDTPTVVPSVTPTPIVAVTPQGIPPDEPGLTVTPTITPSQTPTAVPMPPYVSTDPPTITPTPVAPSALPSPITSHQGDSDGDDGDTATDTPVATATPSATAMVVVIDTPAATGTPTAGVTSIANNNAPPAGDTPTPAPSATAAMTPTVTATPGATATATAGACPDVSGWTCGDVGSPALAGSQSVANEAWSLTGGGTGLGGNDDSFHYAWQQFMGDGSANASITSLSGQGEAGVMIRQDTSPGSPYYAAVVNAQNQIVVSYRQAQDAGAVSVPLTTTPGVTVTLPLSLRVSRGGDTFTATILTSPDGGTTWQPAVDAALTSATIPMSDTVLGGLVVTADNTNPGDTGASTATFSGVSAGSP